MKTSHKIIILVSVITLVILIFTSWTDVEPGSEGFMYYPYDGGVDTSVVYSEGSTMIAPWNEMITYNIRQQSHNYVSEIMDKNKIKLEVFVSVNFHVQKGSCAKLHLKVGQGYAENLVDKKARGAIRDVIGRYTYQEIFSTKRDLIEQEIEQTLIHEFSGNYIELDFVEISDINLPKTIEEEIIATETQKQKQQTTEAQIVQKRNLADARFEEARGDSSLLISAQYKAAAIELESRALKSNPEYTELKKWEKWNGQGSPYGSGNVFGAGTGVTILKDGR